MEDQSVGEPSEEYVFRGRETASGVRTDMAFGFGFNKQKTLNAAEKFVQQGKLQNAIAEYERVLKADPKDLTVSNTVGDLYARLGQNDKAIECFKRVGDSYASQGFTVKAIAMYKKLAKLKPTLESVLRLAELYTQQGLFNDARAQYLQVAEEFLRSGELEQAVRIFQKTLEMDPENVAMRLRLAEAYIRLDKKTEAWQIFTTAADNLRAKGQLAQAEEILQRMLKLDPGNSNALLVRGRTAFEAGDIAAAILNLEKVADLDTHPEGLKVLMQAYLETGRIAEAGSLVAKLSTLHNDTGAITNYLDALTNAGQYQQVLEVCQQYCDRLLATDSGKIVETLHVLIGHLQHTIPALEILLDLLQRTGDTTHITEVYELLAHGCVQSGQLEKARDYYLKLTQLEPQNQLHTRNYEQVLAKLGGASSRARLITAEEGAVLVDELEATAPFIDQRYADEVALAVRAALTDAELFVSYNMPAKAMGPLLSALPKAPRDLRLNQRLAALHTRAGRFAEAAVCCRTLEQLYHEAGHADEATRYGELATKYEQRASSSVSEQKKAPVPASLTVSTASISDPVSALPTQGTEPLSQKPPLAPPPTATEFELPVPETATDAEIDISDEWEGAFSEPPAQVSAEPVTVPSLEPVPTVNTEISETVEEIRFYLSQGMPEQARALLPRVKKLGAAAAQLTALEQEIDSAAAQADSSKARVIEEVSIEELAMLSAAETAKPAAEQSRPGGLREFVADLESSLEDNSLPPIAVPEIAPPTEAPMAEVVQASASPDHSGVLGEFVSDLEESLGSDFLSAAPVPQQPMRASATGITTESNPNLRIAAPAFSTVAPAAAAAAPAPAASTVAGPASAFTYEPAKMRPLGSGPRTSSTNLKDISPSVDLADMFGELKHELEEESATVQEDPETHYNLGVAFREMGLLDEAIAELQKVCQAVDRGHSFPQMMQTYTWLAQCFLDKNVPEAAIRWYEKALKLAGIDEDTRTALNYELAAAHESAGNKTTALKYFLDVYGSNIDYRDVAERIKTLKS
jgi:pilus assembly protein FimV